MELPSRHEDAFHQRLTRATTATSSKSVESATSSVAVSSGGQYHTNMATKTTINFDDEMEAALTELVAIDGTKTLAIKRSLLAEVKRRRRSQALLDLVASWEAEDGPIDREHLDWADAVLDRQGVER